MDNDKTEQDWSSELWPDDGPDPDWPDDWPDRGRPGVPHRPYGSGVPPVDAGPGTRGIRGLALSITCAIALGAGAGAVYLDKSDLAGSAPAATSPSPVTTIGGGPGGAGAAESVTALGRVLAVGHDSVTVGGGPASAISARVTSATHFTGTVRSLAQVRVGDTVMAQITLSDGAALLVSLQDPASQP